MQRICFIGLCYTINLNVFTQLAHTHTSMWMDIYVYIYRIYIYFLVYISGLLIWEYLHKSEVSTPLIVKWCVDISIVGCLWKFQLQAGAELTSIFKDYKLIVMFVTWCEVLTFEMIVSTFCLTNYNICILLLK